MSLDPAGRGSTDASPVRSRWIGRLVGAGPTVRVAEPFVLAGVEWLGPPNVRIELRALDLRRRWSRWLTASVTGHDSDGGRSPAPALYGEPVWTGPATAIQLRSSRPVGGVTLHLVSARQSGGSRARATAASAAAPSDVAADAAATAAAARALPLASPELPAGPGQPAIIARRAWAGRHNPPRRPPEYGDVRMAFVHHSDGINVYSRAEVPAILVAIYDYHVYVRGWWDIGYNFAIDRFGRTWEARAGGIDQAVVGAQAGGYNLESFGAVVLGTYSSVLPTAAALSALERLLAWKLALHGVPVTGKVTVEVDPPDAYYTPFRPGQHVKLPRIAGHRDGCSTDCPGNDLYHHLPKVRAAVQKLVGTELELTLTLGGDTPPTGVTASPGEHVARRSDLRLASARLEVEDQLPVAGRLTTAAGAAVPAAPIPLQQLLGQQEGMLATTTTDGDGRWSAVITAKSNMLVRALHAVAPATASPLVAIGVAPKLTLRPVAAGSETVSGTISPARPHVEISVHRAAGREHRLIERVRVTAGSGAFRHSFHLKPGRYLVQAHSLADATNIEGSSNTVSATVS